MHNLPPGHLTNLGFGQRLFLCLLALWQMTMPSESLGQTSRDDALTVREHIAKGNSFLSRRQFQQAIAEYQTALALDPSSTIARDNIALTHNDWGILYFQQGKFDEARANGTLCLMKIHLIAMPAIICWF